MVNAPEGLNQVILKKVRRFDCRKFLENVLFGTCHLVSFGELSPTTLSAKGNIFTHAHQHGAHADWEFDLHERSKIERWHFTSSFFISTVFINLFSSCVETWWKKINEYTSIHTSYWHRVTAARPQKHANLELGLRFKREPQTSVGCNVAIITSIFVLLTASELSSPWLSSPGVISSSIFSAVVELAPPPPVPDSSGLDGTVVVLLVSSITASPVDWTTACVCSKSQKSASFC